MGAEYDSKPRSLSPDSPADIDWSEQLSAPSTRQTVETELLKPAKREVIPQNPDIPTRLQMNTSLPWDAPDGDVSVHQIANPNGRGYHYETNVAWSVFFGSSGGFATGRLADGGDEFALNVLNQFVPPGSDGFPSVQYDTPHWSRELVSEASQTAHALRHQFRTAFIDTMDYQGGTLSGKAIREWIDAQRRLL